jgi:hypothetical protein
MIIDFGCEKLNVLAAFPGALVALVLVAGLSFLGRLLTRGRTFDPTDMFVGWGATSGAMTLASVLFPRPLLYVATALFLFMFIGAARTSRTYFASPFWLLALFPGIPILVALNAIGLGGFAYDDFSHWVPNALYVFLNNDVPSHALPFVHSIYPGYPYGLPFLTYLASLIAQGFLVQGGAMINALLLLAFAVLLVQSTGGPSQKAFGAKALAKTALALAFAFFLNSTLATFGILNQGDTGTMVLGGALALFLWSLVSALRERDAKITQNLSFRLALIAIAFVLLKEANLVLLVFYVLGFLLLARRHDVLSLAVRRLPVFIPAVVIAGVWQIYAHAEIGGGGVGIQPPTQWRFDLFRPLLIGILGEIIWKPTFFVLFVATLLGASLSIFRKPSPWRDFMLLAAFVQLGNMVFLFAAFLGSDFTDYTVRLAASFHRYMLQTVFLALPAFWIATQELFSRRKLPVSRHHADVFGMLLAMLILPLTLALRPDWIAALPDKGTCSVKTAGRALAVHLPDNGRAGIVYPKNNGLVAFIVSLELALQEAKTGRPMQLAWHADSFHSFNPASENDVANQLKKYPQTNAILYDGHGFGILKNLGMIEGFPTGFLLRRDGEWTSIRFYP